MIGFVTFQSFACLWLQVVSAKIVTSAKNPGSKCYGFLTMVNSEEANKCINHLNNTKLLGNQITVELVRTSFLDFFKN